MSVSGVNNSTNAHLPAATAAATASTPTTAAETAATDKNSTTSADTYEKSTPKTSTTYKPNKSMLASLSASQQAYISNLQNLVSELVNQVGKSQTASGAATANAAKGGIDPSKVEGVWDLLVDNGDGTWSFDPSLSVEDQKVLIAKAQEDIGENGYYGVSQTSGRILDFAKAITGGDPSKITSMRNMVEKSFDAVKDMFGGKLPDISQQTYDAVMKGFDEWEASANPQ